MLIEKQLHDVKTMAEIRELEHEYGHDFKGYLYCEETGEATIWYWMEEKK